MMEHRRQYLINCGITYVKANEFHMRIRTHYQYCQQSDCVMNYEESLTIQKVGIQALMSQMKKTLRPLRVSMTSRPHLIGTILCWEAITLYLYLKEIF